MRSHGILCQRSGVEAHNALGQGERYHSYLRNVFDKVPSETPTLSNEHTLATAVKANNDSSGPDGSVPTLLLFGIMLRLPIRPSSLPDNAARMRAL